MVDRKDILKEAVDRCMTEMYAKSQPSADWHEYLKKAECGEITKDDKIFDRHYLCEPQFRYILNKYKEMYRMNNEWKSNIDFLKDCLENGGYRDTFIERNGDKHRDAEKTPKLEELIGKINAEKVLSLIEDLEDFYHFDREESDFNFTICLGLPSPTSNAETVKEYWKSQGVDIEIDETELSDDDYWEIDKYGHILTDED